MTPAETDNILRQFNTEVKPCREAASAATPELSRAVGVGLNEMLCGREADK